MTVIRLPARPWPLKSTALFLDLDGTLIGFSEDPQPRRADPECLALLRSAAGALDGRLAVISGREIQAVDLILDGAATAVAGVHGLQHRAPSGRISEPVPHTALGRARRVLESFAAGRTGVIVEVKSQSVAVHFRQAPEAGRQALELVWRLAESLGLVLQHGHMVAELRTPGADKGDALRRFMAEPPFQGARPLFLGDDLTDEPAFAAAAALGGVGVLVGSKRATLARAGLAGPAEVRRWLAASFRGGCFDLSEVSWAD